MINEPDIIKQLREEEKTGKLIYNDLDFKKKIFDIIGIKPRISIKEESDIKIIGYDNSLNLAKKALREINNK
jgi:hypothetical protein